jgi:2-polyprenyl-3-methyl-5-hydroxy-6-metoxy-1,4-benzoquinol methylase
MPDSLECSPARAVHSSYEFKPVPFSSHTLLLDILPAAGAGRRVLDLGCAHGYLGEALAARGYTVVGVEKPGLAGDRFPESVELVEADLDQGIPALGRFDYVLCADILEHLQDPSALLRGIRPLLSAGGKLLASLPNSGHAYFRLNVLMGRFPQHDRGLFDRTHLHFYTWAGWVDLFTSNGYRIERVIPSATPFSLALPQWAGTPAVRLLDRIAHLFARFWKEMFAYQFVVSAQAGESDPCPPNRK